MVRDFNEADITKKRARIGLREKSPAGGEDGALIEERVKAVLQGGYVPCPAALNIARKLGVSPVSVGDAADRIGVRVSNCQLGCFKVDKNLHEDLADKTINKKAETALEGFSKQNPLTCAGAFRLAKELGVRPIEVADAANFRQLKIYQCQLGCW